MSVVPETFPAWVLELSTMQTNAYIRQNELSPVEAKQLKEQRRRRKNRGYAAAKRRRSSNKRDLVSERVRKLIEIVRAGGMLTATDLNGLK